MLSMDRIHGATANLSARTVRVRPVGLLGLVGTAVMFRERIPPVARSLYPVAGTA